LVTRTFGDDWHGFLQAVFHYPEDGFKALKEYENTLIMNEFKIHVYFDAYF